MAVDKLVDSAQLERGLSDIADAIRAKTGQSESMEFPDGFVSEIESIPSSTDRGFMRLIDKIVIPTDVRGVNINLTPYDNYDILLIFQNIELTSSDWLYYSPNETSPTSGSYSNGSALIHKGVAMWRMPLGGSSYHIFGYVSNINFSQKRSDDNPINNLYVYTYVANKLIKAGSTFEIYGGNIPIEGGDDS